MPLDLNNFAKLAAAGQPAPADPEANDAALPEVGSPGAFSTFSTGGSIYSGADGGFDYYDGMEEDVDLSSMAGDFLGEHGAEEDDDMSHVIARDSEASKSTVTTGNTVGDGGTVPATNLFDRCRTNAAMNDHLTEAGSTPNGNTEPMGGLRDSVVNKTKGDLPGGFSQQKVVADEASTEDGAATSFHRNPEPTTNENFIANAAQGQQGLLRSIVHENVGANNTSEESSMPSVQGKPSTTDNGRASIDTTPAPDDGPFKANTNHEENQTSMMGQTGASTSRATVNGNNDDWDCQGGHLGDANDSHDNGRIVPGITAKAPAKEIEGTASFVSHSSTASVSGPAPGARYKPATQRHENIGPRVMENTGRILPPPAAGMADEPKKQAPNSSTPRVGASLDRILPVPTGIRPSQARNGNGGTLATLYHRQHPSNAPNGAGTTNLNASSARRSESQNQPPHQHNRPGPSRPMTATTTKNRNNPSHATVSNTKQHLRQPGKSHLGNRLSGTAAKPVAPHQRSLRVGGACSTTPTSTGTTLPPQAHRQPNQPEIRAPLVNKSNTNPKTGTSEPSMPVAQNVHPNPSKGDSFDESMPDVNPTENLYPETPATKKVQFDRDQQLPPQNPIHTFGGNILPPSVTPGPATTRKIAQEPVSTAYDAMRDYEDEQSAVLDTNERPLPDEESTTMGLFESNYSDCLGFIRDVTDLQDRNENALLDMQVLFSSAYAELLGDQAELVNLVALLDAANVRMDQEMEEAEAFLSRYRHY